MSTEERPSLLCGCCSRSPCCGGFSRKKERFSNVGYEVLPKSYKSQWPLGSAHSGKSFTLPQDQSDLNYALLQQWGSQECLSRSPRQMVITQQPMGRESRGSSVGAESLKSLSPFGSTPHDKAPEIDFLLYYHVSNFCLTVHLQRARHLPPKMDKNFVILLYLAPKTQTGDTLQSSVLQDSPDPIINRSIAFQDLKPEEVREQTLVFQLYHGSTMGKLIGGVTLPLSDADLYGMNCTMKIDLDRERIKAVNSGDLLLSLLYQRRSNTLEGIVLKLANLKKQGIAIGLADVYVKIWLLNKGKRTKKWKSTVKQKIPTPVFNESFKFDLGEAANIHDLALELVVMEQDRFSRGVTMGVVYIGMGVPHHTGRQHWEHLIAQPSSRISNWHPILPVTATM